MTRKKVFISFDYDNDSDIKGSLVAQAKKDDSPFEISDMSIKEAIDSNWKYYARQRIRKVDVVIVLCGYYTANAKGVQAELEITQEENKPYFLLQGREERWRVTKPKNARYSDEVYPWTWNNLKELLNGKR